MPLRKILPIILILLVGILIYRVNPRLFWSKAPGSFEYIRKGEALLDKGRYKEAIVHFKKAYEASPENKDIRGALLWAYTKYGMSFAESKNYNQAIENLVKAYEIKPDSATAQNLAIIHSKKALAQVADGDWGSAIESLREAVSLASNFTNASRNLSISLFNDAVEEYKHGREKTALTWLKIAALIYDDSRIFDFIGEIYYKNRNLERALFYWKKAVVLNPDEKALIEKLEKLTKEMELTKREERIASPHFDIRYEEGLAIDKELINQILEDAYFNIGGDLKHFPPSKTAVFLYSEKNFREIFKLQSIVMAFYDGNIRMPYPQKALNVDEIRHYLYHEYAHAVVSAKTNNNCPVWFSEGIAMWEEFKGRDEVAKSLLSEMGNLEFDLRRLSDGFRPDGKDRDMRAYYLLSYTVIKYIVDTWGVDGLRDILKRVADGQHVINAIDDEFLLSEKEFTRRWDNYVRH